MIKVTVSENSMHIDIPREMKLQAPDLLKPIWRNEFANMSNLIVTLTKANQEFVTEAKLNHRILVYH